MTEPTEPDVSDDGAAPVALLTTIDRAHREIAMVDQALTGIDAGPHVRLQLAQALSLLAVAEAVESLTDLVSADDTAGRHAAPPPADDAPAPGADGP